MIDYIPSCLNCNHLKYHSPEIDANEKYHYSCDRYGQFNLAPDVCGSHELNTKYVSRITQCKNCKYLLKRDDGLYCNVVSRPCDHTDYCAWGELKE